MFSFSYGCTVLLTFFFVVARGYNKWMGEAAKGGTVEKITSQLEVLSDQVSRKDKADFAENLATKSTLLYQRGKRYAFEKKFYHAVVDFDRSFDIVEDSVGEEEEDHDEIKNMVCAAMKKEDYARILEWAGMCRHLRYDLKGASECYERCSELEPDNVSGSIFCCNALYAFYL